MAISPLSGQSYGIRWKGDRKEIEKYLKRIVNGIDSNVINRVGNMVIGNIISRTSRGVDVNNVRFEPYTKNYETWKSYIRSSHPVNLKLYDDMLKNLKFRWMRSGSKIAITFYFNDNLQQVKAWVHDTGGLSGRRGARFTMPKRHFFGVNQAELKKLNDALIERLKKLIKESLPQRSLF